MPLHLACCYPPTLGGAHVPFPIKRLPGKVKDVSGASSKLQRSLSAPTESVLKPSTAPDHEVADPLAYDVKPMFRRWKPNREEAQRKLNSSLSPAMLELRKNNINVLAAKKKRRMNGDRRKQAPTSEELRSEIRESLEDTRSIFGQLLIGELREDVERRIGAESGSLYGSRDFARITREEAERVAADLRRSHRIQERRRRIQEMAPYVEALQARKDAADQEERNSATSSADRTLESSATASATDGNPQQGQFERQLSRNNSKSLERRRSRSGSVDEIKSGNVDDTEEVSVDDEHVTSVFKRYQHDHEIHRDSLPEAIKSMGLPPEPSWISDVLADFPPHPTLNREAFGRFVQGMDARRMQDLHGQFQHYDEDGSGMLSRGEVSQIIRDQGITVLDNVLEEIVHEVAGDVGSVDFTGFQKVLRILKQREGFSKAEVTEFKAIFRRYDSDNGGEISAHELPAILGYLGIPGASTADAARITAMFDTDGSGRIDGREFLSMMREYREREISAAQTAFAESDQDFSGAVNRDELFQLVESLGYKPQPEVVDEALEETGLDERVDLIFDDIWKVLQILRSREGLKQDDLDDCGEAFHKFDAHSRGEISTLELGRLLRWLGYAVSVENLQKYVREVDVDGSGRLELKEVLKVVRKLRSTEYEAIEYLFTIYDNDGSGTLSTEDGELQRLLRKLGYHATPESIHAALKAAGQLSDDSESSDNQPKAQADFWGVVRIVAEYRLVARKGFRENAGFSEEQVAKYRNKFSKYDRDQSGDIACNELLRLLEDMFPWATRSDVEQARLRQILARVDSDGDNTIDFKDFLQLCRQYQDERDEEQLTREAAAVEKTGFKPEEVAEFRNVFKSADMDCNQYLSNFEIRHLLSRIVGSFSETSGKELVGIFREFSGDGARQLDFSDFLLLMKRLMDMNFADINTKAAEIVTRSGGFAI
eukprot:gnl/MRDRNA2_/MRDRNA2_107481_c0_seq1.p1 gnl/MRDRNA2_/MRDRNA2_107481_c0~~gnl/MRDRNA2_/MRDRNA2_107481_c0_seq1.p1  ORF type:complete len:960 (+),score=200.42 gnl/MRDRNA2_/MRDRNA2_107481_c0_seq1:57-2882(+)